MKKALLLLAITALLGCEKERCFECAATYSGYGLSESSTSVYCGDMTRSEANEMAMSMTTTGGGVTVRVECKESN